MGKDAEGHITRAPFALDLQAKKPLIREINELFKKHEGQPGRPRHLRRARPGLHRFIVLVDAINRARLDRSGGDPQGARGHQHAGRSAHHALDRRQVRREGPEHRGARHPPADPEGAPTRPSIPSTWPPPTSIYPLPGVRKDRSKLGAVPVATRPPMTAEVLLQGIVSGLLMGLVYALIAAGLSLIFGLMEIVNFAHGEFLMLAMFTTLLGVGALAARPARLAAADRLPPLRCSGPRPTTASSAGSSARPCWPRSSPPSGSAIFLRSAAQALWGVDFQRGQESPRRGPALARRALPRPAAARGQRGRPRRLRLPPLVHQPHRDRARAPGDGPGSAGRLADGHRHPADVRARLGHRGRPASAWRARSSRCSSTSSPTWARPSRCSPT